MRPRRQTTIRSQRSITCRMLWLIRISGSPCSFRVRMMFSTCAVSCTPSAAVGSSMMVSFEWKVAVRAIATHWRWPPDMFWMVLLMFGIFTPVFFRPAIVASRIPL